MAVSARSSPLLVCSVSPLPARPETVPPTKKSGSTVTPALAVLLAKVTSPVAAIVAVLVKLVPATAKLLLTVPVSVITPPDPAARLLTAQRKFGPPPV